MKSIKEQIKVMQHFADGGKVKVRYGATGWKQVFNPKWDWATFDYRIAEEADPYAELKAAAADPTKQIRYKVNGVWMEWLDMTLLREWSWCYPPEDYEIRDKPKSLRKVKLLAWFSGSVLGWWTGDKDMTGWKRVPTEDKEIEVEDD